MTRAQKGKNGIPLNAKVMKVLIVKKWNGWFITAEFDGAIFYQREFVFNSKKKVIEMVN